MVYRLAFRLILCALFLEPLATAQDRPKPAPPTEKEIALGRGLTAELEAEAAPLDDAVVVEFVKDIVQKLAAVSSTQTFLTVRVLDSPELAAHSLPGGFLVVRSGLVASVETTAELAGVLAHEIAHIAAGHANPRPSVPLDHPAGRVVPMIYLGGWMGSCIRVSGSAAFPASFRERAQGQEQEADSLALEYLARAGFDPGGLVESFDRLAREAAPEAARITPATRDKARQYSQSDRPYISTSSAFGEIRERLPNPVLQQQHGNAPSLLRVAEQ